VAMSKRKQKVFVSEARATNGVVGFEMECKADGWRTWEEVAELAEVSLSSAHYAGRTALYKIAKVICANSESPTYNTLEDAQILQLSKSMEFQRYIADAMTSVTS
jgi:hypothetical protein